MFKDNRVFKFIVLLRNLLTIEFGSEKYASEFVSNIIIEIVSEDSKNDKESAKNISSAIGEAYKAFKEENFSSEAFLNFAPTFKVVI